jgi:hypothetical protein
VSCTPSTVLSARRLVPTYNRSIVDYRPEPDSKPIPANPGEERELHSVNGFVRKMIGILRHRIVWSRHLSLFGNGYEYATLVIPSVIIAPRYFAGQVSGRVSSSSPHTDASAVTRASTKQDRRFSGTPLCSRRSSFRAPLLRPEACRRASGRVHHIDLSLPDFRENDSCLWVKSTVFLAVFAFLLAGKEDGLLG